MRKRLRKKLHLGEFREDGFIIKFSLTNANKLDDFCDRFIDEAIDANDLECGGGGNTEWEAFITRCTGSATEADRLSVLNWLKRQPSVKNIEVGPLVDAWHGW